MSVRMRRVLGLALLALASAFVLTSIGCGRSRPSNGSQQVLRYPLVSEPETLDPARIEAAETSILLQNIYEGLVTLDEKTRVVPCLAERWEIGPDGKTYTFHLNPRARFHKPFDRLVTADDIRYSFERLFWPETRSPILAPSVIDIVGAREALAGRRRDLPGVRVLDAHTVRITLEQTRGFFLMEIAGPMVVCREAIEENGGQIDEKAAIGTGPFMLQEYRHGSKVVLAANPDYYGGRPPLDRIERPIVLDPTTTHAKYENDELDVISPAQSDFANDRKNPALAPQLQLLPEAQTSYIAMQFQLQPVFRDVRVRRAFAQAIDRTQIVHTAFVDLAMQAGGFVPYGVLGYNPHLRIPAYDPEAARRSLAEAGYPNGKDFPPLTLVYLEKSPAFGAAAQLVRDDLKRNLGITIDLQEREAGTFFSDTGKGRVAFYLNGWVAIDPHDYLSFLLHTGAKYNTIGYSNPRFDAFCDQGDAALNPQKRQGAYQQADQVAADDVALLPLTYGKLRYLVKPWVREFSCNLGGPLPHYKTRIQRNE